MKLGYSIVAALGLAAAAFVADAEGILVPSATGIDSNLVVFVENLSLIISRIEIVKEIVDLRPIIASLEAHTS
jgi:hypothetical protein